MAVTLHSLFEITEQLPKDTMFYVDIVGLDTWIPMWHDALAQYESDNIFNLYVYETQSISHGHIKARVVYHCVKLPYNYEHKQV